MPDRLPSVVSERDERLLLRLLSGDLRGPEARKLRARLEVEPDLAARFEQMEVRWRDLGAAASVPDRQPDIASGVRHRLDTRRPNRAFAAPWGPALLAVALLLVVGLSWWAQLEWSAGPLTDEAGTLATLPPAEGGSGENPAGRSEEPGAASGAVSVSPESPEPAPPQSPPPAVQMAAAEGFDAELEAFAREIAESGWVDDEAWFDEVEAEPLRVADDGRRRGDAWEPAGWGWAGPPSLAEAYLEVGDEGAGDLGSGFGD